MSRMHATATATPEREPIPPEVMSGARLYADDFTSDEIAQWYREEEEAYYRLFHETGASRVRYEYFAFNQHYALRHLRPGTEESVVLSIGSGPGDEVEPLRDRGYGKFIFLDSSQQFLDELARKFPGSRCLKAQTNGRIELPDSSVDVITCFGVLHHIPNVSTVVAELARVLKPGGTLVLREPCWSMGDWRHPRAGLTCNERGIARGWMERVLAACGLRVARVQACGLMPLVKLAKAAGITAPYNSAAVVRLDAIFSSLFRWNDRYWRSSAWQKLAPTAYFYLAVKPEKAE